MKDKKYCRFIVYFSLLAMWNCSSGDSEGNLVGVPNQESSSSFAEESSSSEVVVKRIDYSAGTAMNKKLGKGINFGNTFDATCEECWGAGPIEKQQIEIVAKMGFKTARLPIRWDLVASDDSPYTVDPAYFIRIKEVLGWFKEAKMRVMINMHHHDSFIYDMVYSDEYCNSLPPRRRKDNSTCQKLHTKASENPSRMEYNLTRVDSIWAQISREFKDFDNDFLLFEIFNEPVYGVSSDYYNMMIARTHKIIRSTNPGRTLVYNTYPWGGASGIKTLELPEDGNIIIDVHYYDPQRFTHQGHNSKCDVNDPVVWAGNREDRDIITKDFSDMRTNANARFPASNPEGIPITIGEFGVSTCNNVASKTKWVQFVRENAEKNNMSWQYWAYTSVGGFEIYRKNSRTWELDVVKALGVDTTPIE